MVHATAYETPEDRLMDLILNRCGITEPLYSHWEIYKETKDKLLHLKPTHMERALVPRNIRISPDECLKDNSDNITNVIASTPNGLVNYVDGIPLYCSSHTLTKDYRNVLLKSLMGNNTKFLHITPNEYFRRYVMPVYQHVECPSDNLIEFFMDVSLESEARDMMSPWMIIFIIVISVWSVIIAPLWLVYRRWKIEELTCKIEHDSKRLDAYHRTGLSTSQEFTGYACEVHRLRSAIENKDKEECQKLFAKFLASVETRNLGDHALQFTHQEKKLITNSFMSTKDKKYKLSVRWIKEIEEVLKHHNIPRGAPNTCLICLEGIGSSASVTHKCNSTQQWCGMRMHFKCFNDLAFDAAHEDHVIRCPICREMISSVEDLVGLVERNDNIFASADVHHDYSSEEELGFEGPYEEILE